MIRRAKISDTDAILDLINSNADKGLMLCKVPYYIYRNIMNFFVAEEDGRVVGCSRLFVVWKDLAEVASVSVAPDFRNKGVGRKLVEACVDYAREFGIARVFALTYQCEFFEKCGFREISRNDLPHKVFGECLKCPKVECCDEHAFIMDV